MRFGGLSNHLTLLRDWSVGDLIEEAIQQAEASLARGANLMNTTTSRPPITEADDVTICQAEYGFRDFDGSHAIAPCRQPATHQPILDDSYSAHLRAAGASGPEVQPHRLPTCDYHYEQLTTDISQQSGDDPHRVWIYAEPTKILVGYTKRDPISGYVGFADGWEPGRAQHVLTITVDLPPGLEAHRVADLVFYATNSPDLDSDQWAGMIREAIDATGYTGEEAEHFSLSVGDTVTVDGIQLAARAAGWGPASEAGR